MNLSKDFVLEEFIRSVTATRLGLDNSVTPDIIQNLTNLCVNVLQPLRDWYGKPIRIASGYRCQALNAYIGGSLNSQHMVGQAADIDTIEDNVKLFDHILQGLPYDQLIWEFGLKVPAWIHVSFNVYKNRKQILRAYRDENGVHYSPFIREV